MLEDSDFIDEGLKDRPGPISRPVGRITGGASMSKKLHLTVITLTLLLANCSQPDASATSAPTDTPTPTTAPTAIPAPTQTPTSTNTPIPTSTALGNSVQVDMFRLIPPGFLSAGYCDMKRVREDPDLKSVFEAVSGGCSLSGERDDVDALMGVVLSPSLSADSSGITIFPVTIRRGNFDREAMTEELQEDFAGASPQDYQGVELTVVEIEQGFELASAFIDETTWVLGPETGAKTVIDMAQGLTTPPLADMGAALPRVFWAAILARCDYEAEGCTVSVFVGLAKGPEGTISTIQLYQFENAEMAADALPAIRTRQEEGISRFGSVRIVGDTITQEGRFVKVEGVLPIEDLSRMFEEQPPGR